MLFFFKEKPIEIVTFVDPNYVNAFEYAPVRPAVEQIPTWWRDTPKSEFNWDAMCPSLTTRTCVGIINQITTGLILPMWSEFAIKWDDNNFMYQFSDTRSGAEEHNKNNTEAPGFNNNTHIIKLLSPWFFRSPVKLQLTAPFYSFTDEQPYLTAPGIITPRMGYVGSNIFLLFRKNNQYNQFIIKQNTPMLQIIPLTDKKVVYKFEIAPDEEMRRYVRITHTPNHFLAKGIKNRRYEKKQKESKCPFNKM